MSIEKSIIVPELSHKSESKLRIKLSRSTIASHAGRPLTRIRSVFPNQGLAILFALQWAITRGLCPRHTCAVYRRKSNAHPRLCAIERLVDYLLHFCSSARLTNILWVTNHPPIALWNPATGYSPVRGRVLDRCDPQIKSTRQDFRRDRSSGEVPPKISVAFARSINDQAEDLRPFNRPVINILLFIAWWPSYNLIKFNLVCLKTVSTLNSIFHSLPDQ